MQNWEPPFEAGGQCVLLAGNSLKGPLRVLSIASGQLRLVSLRHV